MADVHCGVLVPLQLALGSDLDPESNSSVAGDCLSYFAGLTSDRRRRLLLVRVVLGLDGPVVLRGWLCPVL